MSKRKPVRKLKPQRPLYELESEIAVLRQIIADLRDRMASLEKLKPPFPLPVPPALHSDGTRPREYSWLDERTLPLPNPQKTPQSHPWGLPPEPLPKIISGGGPR